jgi:hypothetical protein
VTNDRQCRELVRAVLFVETVDHRHVP